MLVGVGGRELGGWLGAGRAEGEEGEEGEMRQISKWDENKFGTRRNSVETNARLE